MSALDARLDAVVSGPGVRPAVAAILKAHYDAAREKIREINSIWEELEVEALDSIEPQPLKSQLEAIARNLSREAKQPAE
jgi:hypothetical protein